MIKKNNIKSKVFLGFILSLSIQQSLYAIDSNNSIQGQLIDNGEFDSRLAVVTMILSQFKPPVVRITPARPTTIMFPFNLSYCTSNNSAMKIDSTNSMVQGTGNIFSEITVTVDGKAVTDMGDMPDQTVINCKSVDNTPYPIGVKFVDKNPFSFVKLITSDGSSENQVNVSLPSNFMAIDLNTKKIISHKSKDEIDNRNDNKIDNQIEDEEEEEELKAPLDVPVRHKSVNSVIVKNKTKNNYSVQKTHIDSVSRSEIADIERGLESRHFHSLKGRNRDE